MTDLTNFKKLLLSARYWLQGMSVSDHRYIMVLEVMEMARNHHNGTRNGGDPEFIHQLRIFHYLRTLHAHLKNPWMVYARVFAHDMGEDPNHLTKVHVDPAELEDRWGSVFTTKVLKLSKEIKGKPNTAYNLDAIFADEDCGAAKGGDRVDNLSDAVGVFKRARLMRYIVETEEKFLPNLKLARRRFPFQEGVYENIKLEMQNQLKMAKKVVSLEEELEKFHIESAQNAKV